MQEIEQFSQEREIVLPEMCRILNNTFPHKDFSHRFKMQTKVRIGYSGSPLNEEEDIKKVGVTATTIIRNVFRRYLNGETLPEGELPEKSFEKSPICFTNDTYRALIERIQYEGGDKIIDYQKRLKPVNSLNVLLSEQSICG